MIKGWDHFRKPPKPVEAWKNQWRDILKLHFYEMTKILIDISKDTECIVCGEYSSNHTTKGRLMEHIKDHGDDAIEYWITHIIQKSPKELEALRHSDKK